MSRRLPVFRLRSLRNKLALVFFAITGAALAVIYFSVVTQPESNLEEKRLKDLELVAGIYQSQLQALPRDPAKGEVPRTVRQVAEGTDSHVTLFAWEEDPEGRQGDFRGLSFIALFDSREQTLFPRNPALLTRAIRTRRPQIGFDTFQGDDIGVVAQPLLGERPRPGVARPVTRVALYSRDFEEVEATVSFIRERVLLATLAALLLALAGGWLVARRLGRRVRRLEVAAGRGGARELRGPAAGRLQGRARPAHAHLQRDAGPAAPGGCRPQGVHRDRLA